MNNRVFREIFGRERDENGEWRRLHIEKLHSSYHSPNIVRDTKVRRLRWARHVGRMEEGRSTLKHFRCRCEDRFRMDFKEIGVNAMEVSCEYIE